MGVPLKKKRSSIHCVIDADDHKHLKPGRLPSQRHQCTWNKSRVNLGTEQLFITQARLIQPTGVRCVAANGSTRLQRQVTVVSRLTRTL